MSDEFFEGQRVEYWVDPARNRGGARLYNNSKGTVISVDDRGNVRVNWDESTRGIYDYCIRILRQRHPHYTINSKSLRPINTEYKLDQQLDEAEDLL